MANNPQNPGDEDLREQVRMLDQQALSWKNILTLRGQIKKEAKEEKSLREAIVKLGREQARNAVEYKDTTEAIKQYEEELREVRLTGNRTTIRAYERNIQLERERQRELRKTAGGAIQAQALEAKKRKDSLQAERDLIKDINRQRGIGGKLADIFRSKESSQRNIDIARARAGGGVNVPPGGGGGGGGGGTGTGGAGGGGGGGGKNAAKVGGALAGLGLIGLLLGGLKSKFDALASPFKAIGSLAKSNITAPLAQASDLVSGGISGGYGIGGGAISGGGATSILGGLQDIASKIPFIGGLLGGLIGIFKGIVDLVLGIDQGITNLARNLGISKDQAKALKEQFRGIAAASDSIVVNETRLMESQAELTKALGIRSVFSRDILENNVKLKEIAGVELETRKALVQTSIIQGRSATQLTKNLLAQSKAFEFQTGVAFEYRQVLGEATKQAGVLGLIFAKYPEKLTKALMVTKTMGFELKQLDGLADSFLDFESSISKEMEAQVLTGRDLNLTKAREAALNNDLVTLAREITSQVGNSTQFLKLNRIQQEAIAQSVGMSRDALADVLRQQEYYKRLGADNLKQAQAELKALRERGYTQEQISKMIGDDAYNYITQVSTAERLAELMNKIKTVFIEFIEKSGILDFITNPKKIEDFAKSLITRLAGAIEMVGNIIGGLLEAVAKVVKFVSFGTADVSKYEGLAAQVRTGSSAFAGGIRAMGDKFGGTAAPSIGGVLQNGQQQATTQQGPTTSAVNSQPKYGDVYLDGQKVGKVLLDGQNQVYGTNVK